MIRVMLTPQSSCLKGDFPEVSHEMRRGPDAKQDVFDQPLSSSHVFFLVWQSKINIQ
jgi:hypothetical protein